MAISQQQLKGGMFKTRSLLKSQSNAQPVYNRSLSQSRCSLIPIDYLSQDTQSKEQLQKLQSSIESTILKPVTGGHTLFGLNTTRSFHKMATVEQPASPLSQKLKTLNKRSMGQFIPFHMERDNVGRLITPQPPNTNNDDYFELSQMNRSKYDEAFGQMFKTRDVFDKELSAGAKSNTREIKLIHNKLQTHIDNYKNHQPLSSRMIKTSSDRVKTSFTLKPISPQHRKLKRALKEAIPRVRTNRLPKLSFTQDEAYLQSDLKQEPLPDQGIYRTFVKNMGLTRAKESIYLTKRHLLMRSYSEKRLIRELKLDRTEEPQPIEDYQLKSSKLAEYLISKYTSNNFIK